MSRFKTVFGAAAKSGGVHIPFSELRVIFGLGDSRYLEDAEAARLFSEEFNFDFFKRKSHTKACYIHPEETFSFSTFKDESDFQRIKSSSMMAVSQYKTILGDEAMAFLVRNRIESKNDFICPVIFGMTGRVREDDRLEVKKIILPLFNNNKPIGLNKVAVTAANAQRALAYADLTIDQMFNYNMRPDFEANLKEASAMARKGPPSPSARQSDAPHL
jgi:hypothetical protein